MTLYNTNLLYLLYLLTYYTYYTKASGFLRLTCKTESLGAKLGRKLQGGSKYDEYGAI